MSNTITKRSSSVSQSNISDQTSRATDQQNNTQNNSSTKLEKTLSKTSNITKNYIAGPFSGLTAILGTASSITANLFSKTKNDTLDWLSEITGKISLFSNSIFGGIININKKNTIGTIGYMSDIVSSIFAPIEEMYTWRGFGSALDQLPLFFEVFNSKEIKGHDELINLYKPKKGKKLSDYEGFSDSIQKLFSGIRICTKETYNLFKEKYNKEGVLSALKSVLLERPDFNLLSTSVGIITGSILSVIFGLKSIGGKIRDVFGLGADLAVWKGGASGICGDGKKKGDLFYQASGITYTIGTVLDLIYRFVPIENLHLAAIGVDRLGSFFMAYGNDEHNNQTIEDTVLVT